MYGLKSVQEIENISDVIAVESGNQETKQSYCIFNIEANKFVSG